LRCISSHALIPPYSRMRPACLNGSALRRGSCSNVGITGGVSATGVTCSNGLLRSSASAKPVHSSVRKRFTCSYVEGRLLRLGASRLRLPSYSDKQHVVSGALKDCDAENGKGTHRMLKSNSITQTPALIARVIRSSPGPQLACDS